MKRISGLAALALLASCGSSGKREGPRIGGEGETLLGSLRVTECRLLPESGRRSGYRIVVENTGSDPIATTLVPWFYTDRGARLLYANEKLTVSWKVTLRAGERKTLEGVCPFYSGKTVKVEAREGGVRK